MAPVDVAHRYALESAVPHDFRRWEQAGPPSFGDRALQRLLMGQRFAALAAACLEWLALLGHHRPAANHTAGAAQTTTPAAKTNGAGLPSPAPLD